MDIEELEAFAMHGTSAALRASAVGTVRTIAAEARSAAARHAAEKVLRRLRHGHAQRA